MFGLENFSKMVEDLCGLKVQNRLMMVIIVLIICMNRVYCT